MTKTENNTNQAIKTNIDMRKSFHINTAKLGEPPKMEERFEEPTGGELFGDNCKKMGLNNPGSWL